MRVKRLSAGDGPGRKRRRVDRVLRREGEAGGGAQAGQDNLYVESETGSTWSTRLVAVLSEEDTTTGTSHGNSGSDVEGFAGWAYLAFMSDRSLTGYDNRDAVSGQPDEEVFLYDEASGDLSCVSCNPTGARPDGVFDTGEGEQDPRRSTGCGKVVGLPRSIPGWTNRGNIGFSITYQSR